MSLGFEINAEQQELKREVAELAHKLRPQVDYWERKSAAPRKWVEGDGWDLSYPGSMAVWAEGQ